MSKTIVITLTTKRDGEWDLCYGDKPGSEQFQHSTAQCYTGLDTYEVKHIIDALIMGARTPSEKEEPDA